MQYSKLCYLAVCVCVVLTGCVSRLENVQELKRQRDVSVQSEVSAALAQGKGVILTGNHRESVWINSNTPDLWFALHPEGPSIGQYSVAIVEPGTYAFVGGILTVDAGKQAKLSTGKALSSLGQVTAVNKQSTSTTVEYAYTTDAGNLTPNVYYGYGRGYRRGWRDYSGIGMHMSAPVSTKRAVAVHKTTQPWFDVLHVELPNKGLQPNSKKPLVASIQVDAGEVILLDQVYVSQVKLGEAIDEAKGLYAIDGIEVIVQGFNPSQEHNVPAFVGSLNKYRRIERGSWLVDGALEKQETKERYVFIRKK